MESLIGRTFTPLKVNSQAPSKNGRRYWNCVCTLCGTDTVVVGNNLVRGLSGCRKCSQPLKIHPLRRIFNHLKAQAKRRSTSFDLTFNQYKVLITKCSQCEVKLKRGHLKRRYVRLGFHSWNLLSYCDTCKYGTKKSSSISRSAKTYSSTSCES